MHKAGRGFVPIRLNQLSNVIRAAAHFCFRSHQKKTLGGSTQHGCAVDRPDSPRHVLLWATAAAKQPLQSERQRISNGQDPFAWRERQRLNSVRRRGVSRPAPRASSRGLSLCSAKAIARRTGAYVQPGHCAGSSRGARPTRRGYPRPENCRRIEAPWISTRILCISSAAFLLRPAQTSPPNIAGIRASRSHTVQLPYNSGRFTNLISSALTPEVLQPWSGSDLIFMLEPKDGLWLGVIHRLACQMGPSSVGSHRMFAAPCYFIAKFFQPLPHLRPTAIALYRSARTVGTPLSVRGSRPARLI